MNPENMDTKLPQLKPQDWKKVFFFFIPNRTHAYILGVFQVQGE
jgi:hypothetical protein